MTVTVVPRPGAESIDTVFRAAHSVKGMAASLDYAPITELAHRLEDRMQGGATGTTGDTGTTGGGTDAGGATGGGATGGTTGGGTTGGATGGGG